MAYKEDYERSKTLEELEEKVSRDIVMAGIIGNPDRLKVIKTMAEEVANKKFNSKLILE